MFRFLNRFRISTKLVTATLGGMMFVVIMITSQIVGNASIDRDLNLAFDQQDIARLAMDTKAAARQMQLAVRDIRLANSDAEIGAAEQRLADGRRAADEFCAEMTLKPASAETKARVQALQTAIEAYAGDAKRIVAIRQRIADDLAAGRSADTAAREAEAAALARNVTLPIAKTIDEVSDTIVSFASSKAAADKRAVWAVISKSETVSVAMGAIAVLVLAATGLMSVFAVSRPIGRMVQNMTALAGGELQVSITGLERGDEVGDMARATQVFKTSLIETHRLRAEQVAAEARADAQRKQDVDAFTAAFESAIGGIVDRVSSNSLSLEQAASTLANTASTTRELSTTVASASEEASASVQSVAAATEEMAATAAEIGRQIEGASRVAQSAVAQATSTDQSMTKLAGAADKVGSIVGMITAIAQQTNLLALNATIEAARAGSAGRGFAIVASEVKELAAQTADATKDISGYIAEIQSAASTAVGAIKEIMSTIAGMSEITGAIAAAAEEQGNATKEISRNVQQAAVGASEVSSGIVEVQSGATHTGAASSQVLTAAQSLSADGLRLKQEVVSFLARVRTA
ncbi:putative methyl-accepting chemotaxis receptor/sensory transducer; putative signal peptide [Bradyrhizobium sp. ORS 278]|uniref:methyl-accepting chemotaxis protein n=1 Tax=Bradyrhizobium sp. (strain ORS 278) TaxID=114615 RepID=UPI00015078A2|nr:methyl-accepting chemotaxis protein [Bradyrhizobium sp. ORS 278]CAL75917.1 putative methyl-accepting chemotaxis receptor/sensory transducer; putative signal peptide [Bradyrhizobium sp. ORS 278]